MKRATRKSSMVITFPFEIKQISQQAVELVVGENALPAPQIMLQNPDELRDAWHVSDATLEQIHAKLFDEAWLMMIRESIQIIND